MSKTQEKTSSSSKEESGKISQEKWLKPPDPISVAKTMLYFGFVPIPLRGKVPVVTAWEQIKKADAFEIVTRNIDNKKANNVGILCGKASGFMAVDVDSKNGLEKWFQLVYENCLPDTFTVLTGSSGYHYYFQYDTKTSKLHNGPIKGLNIDIRTDGGQLVAPGSIHPTTGKLYAVCNGYDFTADSKVPVPKISAMPDWLYQLITELQ